MLLLVIHIYTFVYKHLHGKLIMDGLQIFFIVHTRILIANYRIYISNQVKYFFLLKN